MIGHEQQILTEGAPIASLDAYRERGGGRGLERALADQPELVIDALQASGLRGRGGAGFPTSIKWRGVKRSDASPKYMVANGAEGEPGTFKDRYLMRRNPYAVIEGLAIAAHVIGVERAFLCVKRGFEPELRAVRQALEEAQAAWPAARAIEIVAGPDEYLFGEEKAMLEVIEGGLPLPRVLPPYMHGLFSGAYGGVSGNPTVVDNVETLAHAANIAARGAEWFRSFGTEDTPGTLIFTVSGDVQRPVVRELPAGITLRQLIDGHAGGVSGSAVKAVLSGVANAVIEPAMLDIPLGFDAMKRAGTGLGSAGFIVYDDGACMVDAAYWCSRFLHVESCNQCPPCKMGSREITQRLKKILDGEGSRDDIEDILHVATWTPNSARCFLATEESVMVSSIVRAYERDFIAHLAGNCRLRHGQGVPKMVEYDDERGFTYDTNYIRKQPDWTYSDDHVEI
jgi:NADH:ubiquinone oxidoreductase subunit F (NADH-binding)